MRHGAGGKAAQNKQRYIDTYGGVSRRKYALILREGEKRRARALNLGQCTREKEPQYSFFNVFIIFTKRRSTRKKHKTIK